MNIMKQYLIAQLDGTTMRRFIYLYTGIISNLEEERNCLIIIFGKSFAFVGDSFSPCSSSR